MSALAELGTVVDTFRQNAYTTEVSWEIYDDESVHAAGR